MAELSDPDSFFMHEKLLGWFPDSGGVTAEVNSREI